MKEASIIGESEDLTCDNFRDMFEVKARKDAYSHGQNYYRVDESVHEEESSSFQSEESFNFKSPNLLPIKSCVKPLQKLKPPSLESPECSPVNLRIKYSDNFERLSVKCDTIKCVAKCSSPELNEGSSKGSSNCEKILINMKSNSRKYFECHEPSCNFVALGISNFKKHNLIHSKYKLKEKIDFDSVPPRPNQRIKFEEESNNVEHILHSFDSTDGNSLVDKTVNCSLCEFFCFTSSGLKRHYSRNHSNSEIQESSEESDYREDEYVNNSHANLNRKSKKCSLIRKHQQKYHQTVDNELIGSYKNFKCFQCSFETPHRITLVRHEKEHSNFVNKSKMKCNISLSSKKRCKISRKDVSSLKLQSAKPTQDVHCGLERTINRQDVNKFNQNEIEQNLKAGRDFVGNCLVENQPFRVDINFKEKREYPTVEPQNVILTSDEEKTHYKNVGSEYHCKSCSYKAHQKYHMRRHILIHLKEKQLKCGQCDYATNLVGCLKQHKLIHRKTKKYSCKFCNFKSNYLTRIRSHFERFHIAEIS